MFNVHVLRTLQLNIHMYVLCILNKISLKKWLVQSLLIVKNKKLELRI